VIEQLDDPLLLAAGRPHKAVPRTLEAVLRELGASDGQVDRHCVLPLDR
jgi:hypothetical protein